MLEILPPALQQELRAAQTRAQRRRNKLRVEAAGVSLPILEMHAKGFVINQSDAPRLRGLVDIYDGGRHLSQCLIVAAREDGDNMLYEFKRSTFAADGAPLDFERTSDSPIALLGSE